MKVLVVLCAVAACCVAYSPALSYAYSSYAPLGGYQSVYPYSYAAASPVAYAAAPAPLSYAAAPAPLAYAAAPAPVAYAAAPAPVAYSAVAAGVKSQYHSQDELGQAAYGHAEPGQVHNAVQDAHGNKVGSFSYVAPNGNVLRTDYVADALGYRVASNALPVAPVHARRRRNAIAVQTPASTQPLAVAAPIAYAAPAPVAYSAPLAYAAPASYAYAAPASYAYAAPAPYAYAAPAVAYSAPAVRPATLTTIVNNPGHAVSYRVD